MSIQFNDTSTKQGLVQSAEITLFGDNGYGQISGNTNRLYQFTNLFNRALDRHSFLAVTADGRWQYEDNNHTDYAIATTSLVADQQSYELNVDHLLIYRVEVLDESGNGVFIYPIDESSLKGISLSEYQSTAGTPMEYDKVGSTLFLYPKPSYTKASGLKVYYQRAPSYFVYSDTTKVPGFASVFHPYIYRSACLEYAITHNLKIAPNLKVLVDQDEQAIREFYSKRQKDERPVLRAKQHSYE